MKHVRSLIAALLVLSFLIISVSIAPKKAEAVTWYNTGFLNRKTITVDRTKIAGGAILTNFTVLVNTTSTDLRTTANGGDITSASGFDIIFTSSNGSSKLNHEIESYDAVTGQITMWVKVPSLAVATDTILYMYYGNAAITTTQEAVTGTWDPTYRSAWHLKESPTNTAPQLKDSTTTVAHLTAQGTVSAGQQTAGIVGGALTSDGSTNYQSSAVSMVGPSVFTIETWFKTTSSVGGRIMGLGLNSIGSNTTNDRHLYISNAGNLYFGVNPGTIKTVTSPLTYKDGLWHHVAATLSASGLTLIVDGAQVATLAGTTTGGGYTGFWRLGQDSLTGWTAAPTSNFFNGTLDETRISTTARTTGWLTTEYNNINAPSTFMSYGVKSPLLLNQYDYRWFTNTDSAAVGVPLASQNTITTLGVAGASFRLRMLINVGGDADIVLNGQAFKLQYVEKGAGTCAAPSGTTPSVYTDITTTTSIAYLNNPTPASAVALTTSANDPTHNTDVIKPQSYQEANNFNNAQSIITANQSGLWDFALFDKASIPGKTYCFRAITATSKTLTTYAFYPEMSVFAGFLTADIVDASSVSVSSPSLTLSSAALSFSCQTTTGTLGATAQKLRVNNTTGNPKWSLSIAATGGPTALWTAGANKYDFNDIGGCTDGIDTDTLPGKLSFAFTGAVSTFKAGCSNTGIAFGSTASFDESTTNAITLASASATAGINCYWDLTNIGLSQLVPAEQLAGSYVLNLSVTVVAN